jgi:hypothetical protein
MSTEWFVAFHGAFARHLQAHHAETVRSWDDAAAWTAMMSDACASASQIVFGSTMKFASRNKRDGFKCEYLSIDCTLHDNTWAPPTLMIELENDPRQLQYSAWKLLCTRSEKRLLISYYVDEHIARDAIAEVSRVHPDDDLHVFLAPWHHPAAAPGGWGDHYRGQIARGGRLLDFRA